MNTFFFQNKTRTELTNLAKEGYIAVVPLAATEQHGLHLPVSTDSVRCEHIVSQAVEQASSSVPLLMTPVLPIGNSDHHLHFGGTLSFSSATYLHVLRDIGESLITSGFDKIIFLNSHGGNQNLMTQTANDLAVKHNVWTAAASVGAPGKNALKQSKELPSARTGGHAGDKETSEMLALRPDLVQEEHIRSTHRELPWLSMPGFIGKHQYLTGEEGFTDAPGSATAERGKVYLKTIISSLTQWLIDVSDTMRNEDVEK